MSGSIKIVVPDITPSVKITVPEVTPGVKISLPLSMEEVVALIAASTPNVGSNMIAVGNSVTGLVEGRQYFKYDGSAFSVGNGSFKTVLTEWVGLASAYPALYMFASNAGTPSASNYIVANDSVNTYLNASNSVQIKVGGGGNALQYQLRVDGNGVMIARGMDIGPTSVPFHVSTGTANMYHDGYTLNLNSQATPLSVYLVTTYSQYSPVIKSIRRDDLYLNDIVAMNVYERFTGGSGSSILAGYGIQHYWNLAGSVSNSAVAQVAIQNVYWETNQTNTTTTRNSAISYSTMYQGASRKMFTVGSNYVKVGASTPTVSGNFIIVDSIAGEMISSVENINTGASYTTSLVVSGTNYGYLRVWSDGYSSTYGGTSVVAGGTTLVSGKSSTAPVVLNGTIIYQLTGTTSTNYATRLSSGGFYIGKMSNIHNASGYPFYIDGGSGGQYLLYDGGGALDSTYFKIGYEGGNYINWLKQAGGIFMGGVTPWNGYVHIGETSISLVAGATTRMTVNGSGLTITYSSSEYGFQYQRSGGALWQFNIDGNNYFRIHKNGSGSSGDFYFHNIGSLAAFGIGVGPTAFLDIAAGTAAAGQLRFRAGIAPAAPDDGLIWFDGADLKMRIGGVTKTFTLT